LNLGTLLIREAADIGVLMHLKAFPEDMLLTYSRLTEEQMAERLATSDVLEQEFWLQIRLSHVDNQHFKQWSSGSLSFFDALKHAGLEILLRHRSKISASP
jgi:hypothetical protein